MPIVFVHGVNNRDGGAYRENEAGRNGFLREVVGPALGQSPEAVRILSPYWGTYGANFAWGMAVLPNAGDAFETFGGAASDSQEGEAFGRVACLIAECQEITGDIVADAQRNFPKTVDVLYAAAMAGATTDEQARGLARSYLLSAEYAETSPHPAWVATASEGNFVDQLENAASAGQEERFGAGGILDSLKEGLSRLVGAVPDASSDIAGRLLRKKLNAEVTRFAGDAFTYLARRGTKDAPGPIVTTVLQALRKADSERSTGDETLTVIAHSFGGEIMYDILTHFAPELRVDCLVTVGSQVGLFEEMKLYVASRPDLPPDAPHGRVALPGSVKRWLNVFDTNDVLSYRLEPVVAGVSDFLYDTGYTAAGAHGGYFLRPSFYRRLALRLKGE
jgi:hypothetical protein